MIPIIKETIDDIINCGVITSSELTIPNMMSNCSIKKSPRNVYTPPITINTVLNTGRGLISPAPDNPYNPKIKKIIENTRPEIRSKDAFSTSSKGAPKYKLQDGENEITA